MRRSVIFLLLILAVLAGCTHKVNVALRPDYDATLQPGNELSKVKPAIQFFKGEFADKRSDPSKLTGFKQAMHTYNLYEERPVEEAIFEGLEVLITTSGHQWSKTEEGEVKTNLQFINCQADLNTSLLSIVSATSGVQIKLDFVDAKTGDVIYTNIYSGNDERSLFIGYIGMMKKSIDASIINCIQSVGDDADLARALMKFKSSK